MSALPSVRAAENFHAGKPGGFLQIVGSTLGRSLIIGAGIAGLTGERDYKRLALHSLAGATAIELFVLYYTAPSTPPAKPGVAGLLSD